MTKRDGERGRRQVPSRDVECMCRSATLPDCGILVSLNFGLLQVKCFSGCGQLSVEAR